MKRISSVGFKYFLIGALFIIFSENASATTIENLEVNPVGNVYLSIQWDNLSEELSSQSHGYAIQWGNDIGRVKNNVPPRQTIAKNLNRLDIRAAGFDRDETYFFRVHSYIKEEGMRGYKLFNSSKILQWRWRLNGTIEKTDLVANDPVDEAPIDSAEEYRFEQIRIIPYAQSAQFLWSRPNLANSEYDGFKITISKKSDLSKPIHKFTAGKSVFKSYLAGLESDTQYYVAGQFYKRNSGFEQSFGRSAIVPFKTEVEYTEYQQARFKRTLQRLKNSGLGLIENVSGTETSTQSTPARTTRTSSRTSSRSTNAGFSRTSEEPTSTSQIQQKINQIRDQIRDLQSELRGWESKLKTSSSRTSSSTRTTSSSGSKRLSLRERILRKLGRK